MAASLFHTMLEEKMPVIFDGAMGTRIAALAPREEDYRGHSGCNEILNITRAGDIISIHTEYLQAGAHVVETNTLGANRIKLGEYGLSGRVHEINRAAALCARTAVDATTQPRRALVCGSLGPTGYLHSMPDGETGRMTFDVLADVFREQARGLIQGGADMLLLETMQDLLEVRAAVYGIRTLMRDEKIDLPLQVQVSMDAKGRMLLGSDVTAFLGAVHNLSPSVIGLNCGAGPGDMRPFIEELLARCACPVAMMPNAGSPKNIDGKAVYSMQPDDFAGVIAPLVTERGLAIVGGCCGTTPAHIRALSRMLEGKRVAGRAVSPKTFLSTGISGIALEDAQKPLIIGERLNTQGSKKTKELVLARNFDELYRMAAEQAGKGSDLIDLCVSVNEQDDEKETMMRLVFFLSQRCETPLCIDSTDLAVIERAVKMCPGAVMINSINFEQNGNKARPVLTLARDFGCPVIALTIDDEGMARTVGKKRDVARRLIDLATGEFGLPERFLYIDPLTFTLATGEAESADAAKATIEAVFAVKDEFPSVKTILGVSNVSYGLKPEQRRALNNLMLYHAGKAGLDAAIFNPLHRDDVFTYPPELRAVGDSLLFNRAPDALGRFLAYFDATSNPSAEQKADAATTFAEASASRHASAASAETPERMLHLKILARDHGGLPQLIATLLGRHTADEILSTYLLPAMAEVGEKMSTGDMILPFVLQAAEVMKAAVSILEPHLSKRDLTKRGTIVLATVYGDVHDIGKNLVASILRNQGFRIIDLGKQVPLETIMATVRGERPDCVGLSALLVSTSREMRRCVEACDREGFDVPIIIGGAAVNREFGQRIERFEGGRKYAGGVYFAKDAFEAAQLLDGLKKERKVELRGEKMNHGGSAVPAAAVASEPLPAVEYGDLLVAPFYGTSAVLRWDPARLLDSIDEQRLFSGYWKGGNLSEEEFARSCDEIFQPSFQELKREILADGLLDAKGLYGFFSVYTNGETLYILDPSDFHTERASFLFPPAAAGRRSLADFFRPEGDLIAVQAVTIGKALSGRSRRLLQEENQYAQGFFLNGIGGYLTELLADRVTEEIRRSLGLSKERGRRYSFGYPGLPGVEEQAKLFDLMGIEERLNITLTPGFQMDPEHSTIGIYIHHPKAEY